MISDKSSFLYWYPKIVGKMNTPRSVIIPFTTEDSQIILGGNESMLLDLVDIIIRELRKNRISFPVFFKTDYFSAKWYWGDSCFVEDEDGLKRNIIFLLSVNQDDDDRPINALVFRQYIQNETHLFAFNNMPIWKERRYFVENKQVLCHHPYWAESDLEFFNEDYPDNWREILHELNIETESEVNKLTMEAEKFAELIDDDGYFSVDFMQGVGGTWYLIDVAEGHKSYHNEECPVFIAKNREEKL